MEQPNELMTLEEIERRYSNKWTVIEPIKQKRKGFQFVEDDVKEGIVRYVGEKDEIKTIWKKCRKDGFIKFKCWTRKRL